MTNRDTLDDLFFFFHDFLITDITYRDKTIKMEIEIPWGQLWDVYDYKIKVEIFGCNYLKCEYAEEIKTPENLSKPRTLRETVDKPTEDTQLISKLLLDVQRHKFIPPNNFILICNSSNPECGGGKIRFDGRGFKVYDNEGKEIDLDQMAKWSESFWKRISESGNT